MCPYYFAVLHLEDCIYTSGKFAQFRGHLLAVWLKCIAVSRMSFPDLSKDNCHLNVSLVLCCITFGRLHIHKWKVCTISGPFTCRLTQMYSSIKNEFSRPFFGQLPPKCVPSPMLYYIWKIAYTQVESLHNFKAIYMPFDSNVFLHFIYSWLCHSCL